VARSWCEFFTGRLHMLDGHDVGLVDSGAGKRIVGQAVDFAWGPLGYLEHGLNGTGLEQGQFAADQTEAVFEVCRQLLAAEPAEVVAHHDALGQRFVHRHGQAPAQFGQPHQQQAQEEAQEQSRNESTETDWMELVEGYRGNVIGAEVRRVERNPLTREQKLTVAIPKSAVRSTSDMEEVRVVGQAPEKRGPQIELPEIRHQWVDDYDNDYYGLILHIGESETPIRIYFDSSSAFPNQP